MAKKLYTSADVAEMVGRSKFTVAHVAPRYASYKLGSVWVWTDEDIETYKGKQRRRPEELTGVESTKPEK